MKNENLRRNAWLKRFAGLALVIVMMLPYFGVRAYAGQSFINGVMVIDDYATAGTLKTRVDALLGGSSSTLYQSVTSLTLAGPGALNEADWKFFRDNLTRATTCDLGGTQTTYVSYVSDGSSLPWLPANTSLVNVVLPPTVTKLGKGAFYNCDAIVQVQFKNGENNVETLLEKAFSDCARLAVVSFPRVSVVNSGGSDVFASSPSISTFYLGEVATVPSDVFSALRNTSYMLPKTVSMPKLQAVPEGALANRTGVETVDFSGATSIGATAFKACTSLKTAQFASAVSIGTEAFRDCPSLGVADFPSLTSVGSSVFYNSGIQVKADGTSFPKLATIGPSMFFNCTKLSTVYFPAVISVGDSAFRGCAGLKEPGDGSGTRRVAFPNLKQIGPYAFSGCASASIFHFPVANSVGTNAFNNCNNLESISLPKLNSTMGQAAFYSCPKLRAVVIGRVVMSAPNFDYGTPATMVTFYSNPGSAEEWTSYTNAFLWAGGLDRSTTRKMVKYNEDYLLNDADFDVDTGVLTQEIGSYLYLEHMSPVHDVESPVVEGQDAFIKSEYLPLQAVGSTAKTSAKWGWHRDEGEISGTSKPYFEKDPLVKEDEGLYSAYVNFYYLSASGTGSYVRAEFPAVKLNLVDPIPPEPEDKGPHGGYVTSTTKCEVCHSAHRAKGSLDGTNNYIQREGGKVCMNCHTTHGAGGSALLIEWPASGEGPHGNSWCTDCHQGGIHGFGSSKFAAMNTYMLGSKVDEAITQGLSQGNTNENLIYNPSDATTKNGAYWFQNGGSLLSPQGDPPMNVTATQFAAARATATGYLCNQSGCHKTIGPTSVINTSGFSSDYGLYGGKIITGHGTGAFEQSATDPSCAPCHPGGLAGGYRHDENYLTNQKAATYGCDQCHDVIGVASNTTAWPHASMGIKVYEWDKDGHKEIVTPTYEKNLWMYTYDVGVPYQTSAFSSQIGQNGDGKANVADNWNQEFRVVSDARDENGVLIHGKDALCLKCHVPVDAASKEARGADASTPLNPGTRYSHHYQVNALGKLDVDDPSQYTWDVEGSAPGAGYKGSKLIFLFR